MFRTTRIHSFPLASPSDMAPLRAAVLDGRIRLAEVVCIYAKTEGNGQDNDYSREVALLSLAEVFKPGGHLPLIVASGGCEGVLSPHVVVVQRSQGSDKHHGAAQERGLAVGVARTRTFNAAEVGTVAQAHAVRDAVQAAMADAGLAPADVQFVQVKAPLLTDEAIREARLKGAVLAAARPHASKIATRSACALGVGLALGDVDSRMAAGDPAVFVANLDEAFWTSRTMVTPGNLDLRADVVVYGMAAGWAGPHRVGCTTLRDLIDLDAAHRLLVECGFHPAPQLPPPESARIDGVLFKGDPPSQEHIRGHRHVMWRDSDIQPPRHVRAAAGGLLGGLLGTTRVFCAGGAEHQAPDGGATLTIFYRENTHA
jgi:cyanuric acid amidohydrolase